jgi:hypothetical protein
MQTAATSWSSALTVAVIGTVHIVHITEHHPCRQPAAESDEDTGLELHEPCLGDITFNGFIEVGRLLT